MTDNDMAIDERREWLEADGLGGFASGTAGTVRTRRYHAWLLASDGAPTRRFVLVNGVEAWIVTPDGRFALSSQRYGPDIIHPEGATRIRSFTTDPWPHWIFKLSDGLQVEHQLFARRGFPLVAVSWKLVKPAKDVTLTVRPLMSGRDPHLLQFENDRFRFDPERHGELLTWRPYEGVPGVLSRTNGAYEHEPTWYRRFHYRVERVRGLDHSEDLASPGVLSWDLSAGEAVWLLAADTPDTRALLSSASPRALMQRLRTAEKRRRTGHAGLDAAVDTYLVRRGKRLTVIAGYPWFTDWGRDTFIALRGLCLATGRLAEAREILLEWAGMVSEGMLPNRFVEDGDAAEFNSVDASLWFVIAAHEWMEAMTEAGKRVAAADRRVLRDACRAILDGYERGTRFGIRADEDGLLAAGEPGVQLTWMDAKFGDWVVTPRIGKPVEVQALWLNALKLAGEDDPRRLALFERGLESFRRRFWNEERGCLYDVVDVDHVPGTVDASLRPNQLLAVGGLPVALIEGKRARAVVDLVERELWTPMGLRSLAPGEPGYSPGYLGDLRARDGAYHQGTVWTWLAGPFVEAWVRARGSTPEARREARTRFLEPLLRNTDVAGIGHLTEIADGDPPHTPRGCPFQAWSVGEALRLDRVVLGEARAVRAARSASRTPKPRRMAASSGRR